MVLSVTKLKFSQKIIFSCVLSLFLLGGVLTFEAGVSIKKEMLETAQNNQNVSMQVLKEVFNNKGDDLKLENNQLIIGNHIVNNNFEIPDRTQKIAGGVATIFMKTIKNSQIEFERISTNIILENGKRAVGTLLARCRI